MACPTLPCLFVARAVFAPGGCTDGVDAASFVGRQKLANISPNAASRRSRGAALTASLAEARPCTNDRQARLRYARFVPAGYQHRRFRDYGCDDSRLMLRLSRSSSLCSVRARAGTGQEVETKGSILGWFPQARQTASSDTQRLWLAGRKPGGAVGINTEARRPLRKEVQLASIQR